VIDKNNPNDYVICPLCSQKFGSLSMHLIRKHDITDLEKFKSDYNLISLSSISIRNKQSSFMSENNNSMNGRSEATKQKISQNRTGKGIGVAGQYERTDEIKSKISRTVAQRHQEGAYRTNKYGCKGYIFSRKMKKLIYYESSWEKRIIECFDIWKRVESFYYEPCVIPYNFVGVEKNYIPDFHVKYDEGINSIWEIKRQDHIDHNFIVQEKMFALQEWCYLMHYNLFMCTLKDIEGLENFLKNCPKDQLNEYE
jgi:hypothetical protein